MVCATSKVSDQPAHTHSLIRAFTCRLDFFLTVKLLTEHHLEFLSLKGGCAGSSESTLVKILHCWKSHVVAHFTYHMYVKSFLKHACTATCCCHFLHLCPYFVCVSNEGSVDAAGLHSSSEAWQLTHALSTKISIFASLGY